MAIEAEKLANLSPVIVVGMHRSGTSLVSRFLGTMNVFMGSTLSSNYESLDFQTLNKNTMEVLGCSWADVRMFPTALMLQDLPRSLVDSFQSTLVKSVLPAHFLNLTQHEEWGNISAVDWGWKDPRNSVLLPLYLTIFPQARVVFVVRDSRDVALSLIRREEKRFHKTFCYQDIVFFKKLFAYIKLWCDYNQRILETVECFPGTAIHLIKYEELVREPFDNISALSAFLGVCLTEKGKGDLSQVDSRRIGKIDGITRKMGKPVDLSVMRLIREETRSMKQLTAMQSSSLLRDYIDNIQEFNELVLSKRRLRYMFARLSWTLENMFIGSP